MNIYLIGMMGSGKTTIGLELSKYLNYRFIDTDTEIEQLYQLSPPQMFAQLGEEAFREAEMNVLNTCDSYNQMIVATGGGVVEKSENRKYLNARYTIFLNGSEDLLWERVKADENRPLATSRRIFQERYQKRELLYKESARVVIHIDDKTVKDIVAEILFHLAQKKGGMDD